MSEFRKRLRRSWWIFIEGNLADHNLLVQRKRGHFRVLYPEGAVSHTLSFVSAQTYKNAFGGRVIDHDDPSREV